MTAFIRRRKDLTFLLRLLGQIPQMARARDLAKSDISSIGCLPIQDTQARVRREEGFLSGTARRRQSNSMVTKTGCKVGLVFLGLLSTSVSTLGQALDKNLVVNPGFEQPWTRGWT